MNENISCKIEKLSKSFSGFQESHYFTPKFLTSLSPLTMQPIQNDKKENDILSTADNLSHTKTTLTPKTQRHFYFDQSQPNNGIGRRRKSGQGSVDSEFKKKKVVAFSSENTYVFF